MRPVHILAKAGEIAASVVTAGDPARVEQLSGLLSKPRVVNTNRGFVTYTGRYRGRRVTVCAHGIGGPSAAIVFEELYMLGARRIVRLGTCGGLVKELGVGDLVVPTKAAYSDGFLSLYLSSDAPAPVPDGSLTERVIQTGRLRGLELARGMVFSNDAFYTEDISWLSKWVSRGAIAVEMECATLFALGKLRNFGTASILVVSNSLVRKGQKRRASAQSLRSSVEAAGRLVLDVLAERH